MERGNQIYEITNEVKLVDYGPTKSRLGYRVVPLIHLGTPAYLFSADNPNRATVTTPVRAIEHRDGKITFSTENTRYELTPTGEYIS